MSSPIQLSQPFLSDSVRTSHSNIESSHNGPRDLSPSGSENLDYAAELPDFLTDHGLRIPESDMLSFPGSLPELLQTPFSGSRLSFAHLRNVSIDDSNYRQLAGGRGHSHSLSLVLNLADPPFISHSKSSSTFHLVPPLLLLVSNQLLADSPYSAVVTATTPGKRGISKSFSLGNVFATPSRVSNSPSVKVGKTPLKGHRRTRSKALEAGSSNLLATIANMKSTSVNQMHNDGDTSLMMNPFDTTLVSPGADNLSDYDATLLTTPAKFFNSTALSSQYFTPNTRPVAHSSNFGGSLDPEELIGLRPKFLQSFSGSQTQNSILPRSETLESMNIEEQDDDACKQLRKAKSNTTFHRPSLGSSRASSLRNFRLDEYLGNSPSKAHESHDCNDSFDLLLTELVNSRKKIGLPSYPASIDLASITKLDSSIAPQYATIGLLPPMATMRSAPLISTSCDPQEDSSQELSVTSASAPNISCTVNLSTITLKKSTRTSSKSSTSILSYPSATEIHKASTTEEIANYAEKILNSDLKRPIVVQDVPKDQIDPKKKHKCPLCFARFQRPEHVKRHLKSHSDEKPFVCDFPDCDKRFNRKDNLKAHLKKIHGTVF